MAVNITPTYEDLITAAEKLESFGTSTKTEHIKVDDDFEYHLTQVVVKIKPNENCKVSGVILMRFLHFDITNHPVRAQMKFRALQLQGPGTLSRFYNFEQDGQLHQMLFVFPQALQSHLPKSAVAYDAESAQLIIQFSNMFSSYISE